jgi:predicted kinase
VARTDLPSASDDLERDALPQSGDLEVLQQRQKRLPPGHPSSPTADEGADDKPEPAKPAAGHQDGPDARPTPDAEPHRDSPGASAAEAADRQSLTDAEDAERVQTIREWLEWARDQRMASDDRYLADRARGIWVRERRDAHDDIIEDLYRESANVPCEREAIIAGGLGGAGKSTVLDKYAGVDRSRYLTINPDDIKEVMAERGLIPELDGLSPMEASDLVHEESSHIAYQLADRAMRDGKNIIWDITMSRLGSVLGRLDGLDDAAYSTKGVFVDISTDVAVERADARHRIGHEDYRAGIGFGGRYVPPEVIQAQTDPEWGSINRRTFEEVKSRFVEWAVYDNSVTGREPQLVQASQGWKREEER